MKTFKVLFIPHSLHFFYKYLVFWWAHFFIGIAYLVSLALGWRICYMWLNIWNLGWCIWYIHQKNMRICVYILWINLAQSTHFCALCGKKYAGLKKYANAVTDKYQLWCYYIWDNPLISWWRAMVDRVRSLGAKLCGNQCSLGAGQVYARCEVKVPFKMLMIGKGERTFDEST